MVAGGMLLFIFAVGRVLSGQGGSRKPSAIELEEAQNKRDASVFPIAIPLIAGPGAMTVVMFHMKQVSGNWALQMLFIACLIAVLVLMFVLLLSAVRITRVLGVTGTNVITRIFGIILAAMAIQFIMNGIQQFMQQFINS
jgi:multiple antibiotic resistance protein